MKKLVLIVGINLLIVLIYTGILYNLYYSPILSFGITVCHAFINVILAVVFVISLDKKRYIPFFISVGVVLITGLSACSTVTW